MRGDASFTGATMSHNIENMMGSIAVCDDLFVDSANFDFVEYL